MKKKITWINLFVLAFVFTAKTIPMHAMDTKIDPIEASNVLNWIDEASSYYDEEGLHGIRKYNDSDPYANGIGIKQQFNVMGNHSAEIEFQIPDYEDETRTLKENHVDASTPYDLYLVNVDTGFHSIFRIWSSNSSKENEQSSWVQFCESETSSWETYSGGYISGVCTDASSFKIKFDKENYLSFYCSWMDKDAQMIPFSELGEIGDKKDQYRSFMEKHYKDARYIEFWFAHQKLEVDTVNEVVIKSLNQQSFIVDENNKINDTCAPLVPEILKTNEESVYTKNTEYTLRIEKWLNTPNTKADFYLHPIVDFASVVDDLVASVKVKIKHEQENEYKEVGKLDEMSSVVKAISFPEVGNYEMIVEIKDLANHVTCSTPLQVKVVKGYDIVLNEEVKEQGKTDEVFVLPTATATDENNIAREVTIKVEDPIGNEIIVENQSFVPNKIGVYYITYSSSYVDENQIKHSAKEIVREVIIVKNETINQGKKGCNGSMNTTFIALLSFASLQMIIKKKKG